MVVTAERLLLLCNSIREGRDNPSASRISGREKGFHKENMGGSPRVSLWSQRKAQSVGLNGRREAE